jgi:uncharacterized membrane protein
MTTGSALALAVLIGVVAGLRSFTAPAAVAWAAHLGWLDLAGSPLRFMGSTWAVAILTVAAVGELIADQLPNIPARTTPGPLGFRIAMGLLTGACLGLAAHASAALAAVCGALGAVAGAFGGYTVRVGLVRRYRVPDVAIAVPEDLIAIGLALLVVSQF